MPLTPIFHPQEDWYQAMVTKNKGSLKATNRQEEWYEEIVDSMASGGDGNIFIVNATFAFDSVEEEWSVTLDKTFAEISASANAGKIVLCIPYESASGATGYPCVMTVESIESFANTDVEAGNDAVYSFSFGIDINDDTYVEATTWSKSGGGALVVHDDKGILDKTWQEIHDAMLVGGVVLSLGDTRAANISGVDYSDRSGSYVVSWCNAGEFQIGTYTASSADDYPTED